MKHLSVEQQALWKRISYFFVDDGKSSLSFIDRLMRENNWERSFALRAFDEYKKFMFLICIAEHPLTPSDEVDQVWHLHLLYTQSYWDELCGQILNKKIQHGPTKGGKKEGEKFFNWYESTKLLYESTFGYAPPQDIWKPSSIRFSEVRFQRVNTHRYWIIPKPHQLWHYLKNLLQHKLDF